MSDPTFTQQPVPTTLPPSPVEAAGPTELELELSAEVAKLREELANAVAIGAARAVVDVDDEPIELPDVQVGDWVRIWWMDPQEGPESVVEGYAHVLRVVELGSGPAVVVAWAAGGGVSAPIPLDWRLHGKVRVDAPHVELVGT
jgi:hypothetical protein